MKKVILILIAVLFLATGCYYSEEYFDECKEYALINLHERYNEDFVYVRAGESYGPFGNEYPTFYVKTTNINSQVYNEEIYVTVEEDSKGNKIVSDKYVAIKYKEEVQELLESIAKKYFTNVKVYLGNINLMSEDLTDRTTLEEFLTNDDTDTYATIEIKESDFDYTKIKQLGEEWLNKVSQTQVNVVVTKNEFFGTYSSKELNNIYVIASTNCDFSELVAEGKIIKYDDKREINIYRNNVVAQKYNNKLQDYFNSTVINNLPNAIFISFSNRNEEPYNLDLNATFEEYLRDGNSLISSSYGVKSEEFSKEALDNIINKFLNDGLEFHLIFYIIDDENVEGNDIKNYPEIEVIKILNEKVKYKMNGFNK